MPLLKSPRDYVADIAANIYSKDGALILNSGNTGSKARHFLFRPLRIKQSLVPF